MISSRARRVAQWQLFMRQWHLIDATGQDVFLLGEKVARHLTGRYKPIYHPETDCGDHVAIINCKDVAMHGFDWKHTIFHYNKEYPRSKADIVAYQLQEYDPCRVMFASVYKALGRSVMRRWQVERLHLFANDSMPDFVRKNIGAQLEQIQSVPRRSDEYSAEERAAFPRLFKFGDDDFVEWRRHLEPPVVNDSK